MSLNDKDLDDTMAADWAAIQEKYAGDEPEIAAPEVEAPAEVVTASDTERARDESGKFVEQPKEKKSDEKGKSGATRSDESARTDVSARSPGANPSINPVPDPAGVGTERDINRAPSTWKPTARAEWEKLPPTVRAEIHRRETDFLNGQSQLLPDAKFGKSVSEIMAPYKMLIEAEGGTYERAIADMMKTAAMLRLGTPQQKQQLFLQTARQFGVELQGMAQPGEPGQQQPQTLQDPRVDQLLAQLNQERQQALEGTVTSWIDQKDAQDQPLHPYLGDVMTEMSALVPQIRQQSPSLSHDQVLQQAYERATWGNPEIRTLLLQQQAQGASQTRSSENQNRVREARRAASVNVPRRASIPNPGKPGSMDDTLTETARTLGLIT